MNHLPPALQSNPLFRHWLTLNEDETVTLRTGKVELGQGVKTALVMIAAEELELDPAKILIQTGNTLTGPNELITAGSMSIEGSGLAIRQACADMKEHLVACAAERFQVTREDLSVIDGVIHHNHRGRLASYWQLKDKMTENLEVTGNGKPKDPAAYKLVGRTLPRIDLPAKISGKRSFIQDHVFAETVHARVVRPQSLAYRLCEPDLSPYEENPDIIKIVRDGNFVAVVSRTEETAIKTRDLILKKGCWERLPDYRVPENIQTDLRNNIKASLPLKDGTPVEEEVPEKMISGSGQKLASSYTKPHTMHASIGPSAAIAEYKKGKLTVYSHSQGPYMLRNAIAQVLTMQPEDVAVIHMENAGCYGHNGADDAAMDAALAAFHCPEHTILLKWTRADEHQWEPYSPAMVIDLEAYLENGRISHWNADIYSQTHMGRPFPFGHYSNLVAGWQKSQSLPRPMPRPGMQPHGGIHRNADPLYSVSNKRIVKHLAAEQTIRTSSTRSLGAFANVFAIESFMDELALAAGQTPLEFRLRHLEDERGKAVLRTAWESGNEWLSRFQETAGNSDSQHYQYGSGIAFARYKNSKCYAAVWLYLKIDTRSFKVALVYAVIAADAGQVIDHDGLSNQLEGGLIQAISWSLKESVRFNENGPDCPDWKSYPILRFTEVPEIQTILLDQPLQPPLGAGEATQGLAPAAIANALFNATGVRFRDLPFTPDQIRAEILK